MSVLVSLTSSGVVLSGAAPPRLEPKRPAEANSGRGDSRKGIVPGIAWPDGPVATRWEGGAFVSLAEHLAEPQAGSGLLFQTKEDPAPLAGRAEGLALIAVEFHKLNDGRGYSLAVLLRTRIGWAGPLRALGAVTVDQLQALARCGFDSFELRADQDAALAERALSTFSLAYQTSVAGVGGALKRRSAP